jgi:uncharacterized protein DUF6364
MVDLTIKVDDEVLSRAEARAQQEQTSLDALVRGYLESYAGSEQERARAIDELLELSARARSSSEGRRWTRDELHERR